VTSAKEATGPALESDVETDTRETLRIASCLLRRREYANLSGLWTPGGNAGPDGADWLADLVERAAELPVDELRKIAGLPPLKAGRRVVESRGLRAVDEATRLVFEKLMAAKGESERRVNVIETLAELACPDKREEKKRKVPPSDRRTIDRRIARARARAAERQAEKQRREAEKVALAKAVAESKAAKLSRR
jgi:hypothetical protein